MHIISEALWQNICKLAFKNTVNDLKYLQQQQKTQIIYSCKILTLLDDSFLRILGKICL